MKIEFRHTAALPSNVARCWPSLTTPVPASDSPREPSGEGVATQLRPRRFRRALVFRVVLTEAGGSRRSITTSRHAQLDEEPAPICGASVVEQWPREHLPHAHQRLRVSVED